MNSVDRQEEQKDLGFRIVVEKHGRVQVVEPWKAGEHDPPMQDWLRLPVGNGDCCPSCGSSHFGTINPRGYFLVRECHDEFGTGCRQHYRDEVDAHMIGGVVDALIGRPRRFGMGP